MTGLKEEGHDALALEARTVQKTNADTTTANRPMRPLLFVVIAYSPRTPAP
jgi:hypothetical protein